MAEEGHSKASWLSLNDEIQGNELYDDIVEELVINQVNFPSLLEGTKVKRRDPHGYKDIGVELVTNPSDSFQEAVDKLPLSPKSGGYCDSCYGYEKDGFLPTCSFGDVIYPQISYREEPPLIFRLVFKDYEVVGMEEVTSDSLEEKGTRLKSQGQHKNPHKGIGEELVKNPPCSLQVPKMTPVLRKAQEALEKKLKKMTRHEQNLLILKKFLKVFPEKEGGYNGVFFATSFPSRADVGGVEKMVKKMATRLALVSLREWMLNVSTYLGLEVTDSNFDEAFEEPLFKSVAHFILHAFDLEDFERFNWWHKLEPVYAKFWNYILSNLKEDYTKYKSWPQLLSELEIENPFKFVAEGKINLDDFPSLREQDVGHILRSLVFHFGTPKHVVGLMDFGWPYNALCFFKEGCHDRFIEMARTVLLQYVPMEEDIKMYSILGRGCTLYAICDDALSNIDRILELEKCDEILAQSFKGFLASMIKRRYDIIKCICKSVIYVLRDVKLGSFAKEVFELVYIAEVRRRFLSHRFISKHHILWAVRLTEFKDFVDRVVEDIGLKCSVEKPATRPPYSIYISAQTTADIHGDEVAGVEHIVVATIFEMSQRGLRKNLNEFNNIHCIKEFVDAVRDYKRKYNDQKHLDKVNLWNEGHLDDDDPSLYAEDDECEVDAANSGIEDHHSDISMISEDDECDVDDIYFDDDDCLEYVNKNKIKNHRSKKYKTCRWSDL